MPSSYPGDSVIPDAVMIYDRSRLVHAAAADIWPWIVQLGKGRGGWYLTSFWERYTPLLPPPTRTINPAWQGLAVGDRVDDYGFADEFFIVEEIEAPKHLVYWSERYGTVFTWAILLEPNGEGDSTVVHLRFRGRIQSTGWKRWLIVKGGDIIDYLTTAPMLAGLAERAERRHQS